MYICVMDRLKSFWSRPAFYFQTRTELAGFIIGSGLFAFMFLTFFQPFGVNNYNPEETITPSFAFFMFVFGLIIMATLTFNEGVIRRLLRLRFTQGVRILWLAWTLSFLGTVIFLMYNYAGGWHDFNWASYFGFVRDVSAMAAIPFGLALLILQFRRIERKEPANQDPGLLLFDAENGKDQIALSLDNLMYLESQDNYTAIYYLEQGRLCKTLIRSSLKRLEQQVVGTPVIRCHRSFLVNLRQVLRYQSKGHSLHLFLPKVQHAIPVSRSYVSIVRQALQQES